MILIIFGPINTDRISSAIDVDDGTLEDWDDAHVQLYDDHGDAPVAMTDLTFVAFDFDDTWLYVRWDLYDNLTYSPGILYDMGINISATQSPYWEIYVSAELDLVGGVPVIVNISIRDAENNHIWNASDNGNITEDGTLYIGPTPGLPPGNLSVEARFPLAYLGISSSVIFGQFRSHSSPSVKSAVKDRVPVNKTDYIILVIDNFPPEISNLTDTPDPQENGGFVNITVDVTDDIGVEGVWVNITYPDGTWINNSMMKGSGDKWYFNAPYDDLGIYSYTVWANDTNNWNSTSPATFTIQDTDGPYLDNLNDVPDPQENGNHVNITVDVTDDVGVDEVCIIVTYPDSTWLNVSMQKGPDDEWYFTTTYDDLGIHTYRVWAKDTSNNWNNAGPGTFTIVDKDGPYLDNLIATPDPQENGDHVNITVDVIDDIGVDTVWVNITYPDGSWTNVSMKPGEGDEWYFNTTFDDLGVYSYKIWTNDTSNNWEGSGTGIFTIQDTDGPVFDNLNDKPDPQEKGGKVNITVDVTDDVGVDEVWIHITYPDGTRINVSMNKGPGDQWFCNKPFSKSGDYTYEVWAVDTSGNWNSTEPEDFTIEPPKWLYMFIMLFFWPLLLILFTIALAQRYGFGNRFKRDVNPITDTLLDYYASHPGTLPSDTNKIKDIVNLSVKMGIPGEEYILATLTVEGNPQIEGSFPNLEREDLSYEK
jgi:hypothetical protein